MSNITKSTRAPIEFNDRFAESSVQYLEHATEALRTKEIDEVSKTVGSEPFELLKKAISKSSNTISKVKEWKINDVDLGLEGIELPIGTKGDIRLTKQIALGSEGAVFSGIDLESQEKVAVKLSWPFEREHSEQFPHTAHVHNSNFIRTKLEALTDESDLNFPTLHSQRFIINPTQPDEVISAQIMEFIEGESLGSFLEKIIDELSNFNGAISQDKAEQCLALLQTAYEFLELASDKRILISDFSSENLIVSPSKNNSGSELFSPDVSGWMLLDDSDLTSRNELTELRRMWEPLFRALALPEDETSPSSILYNALSDLMNQQDPTFQAPENISNGEMLRDQQFEEDYFNLEMKLFEDV